MQINEPTPICPGCDSLDVRPSQRFPIRQALFSLVSVQLFRRKECNYRFWRLGNSQRASTPLQSGSSARAAQAAAEAE